MKFMQGLMTKMQPTVVELYLGSGAAEERESGKKGHIKPMAYRNINVYVTRSMTW